MILFKSLGVAESRQLEPKAGRSIPGGTGPYCSRLLFYYVVLSLALLLFLLPRYQLVTLLYFHSTASARSLCTLVITPM